MILTGGVGYFLMLSGGVGILLVGLLMLKRRPLSYYFFGISFLTVAYSALILAAIKTKLLVYFPHLFLTPQPFQFLIGPATFYFILLSLNPYHRFRTWELLHLLPFIINGLDLLPFYLEDAESKLSIIEKAYNSPVGMHLTQYGIVLNYFQYLFLKGISIFLYSIVSLRLITLNRKKGMKSYLDFNDILFKWISLEVGLKIILGIAVITIGLFHEGFMWIDMFLSVAMITDSVVGFGFIFLNPKIIEGTKPVQLDYVPLYADSQKELPTDLEEHSTETHDQPLNLDSTKTGKIFDQIESYFQSQKPFLLEEYSRELLGEKLKLSPRKISEAIKLTTGVGYSDYVNAYRIRHLEEMATQRSDWKKFTIDAIGYELGFSSRISFYNATKRHRNMTPSELLENLGLGKRD